MVKSLAKEVVLLLWSMPVFDAVLLLQVLKF